MLEIDQLVFAFHQHRLLDSLTLTLPPQTHMALMGPSGCGKSTLLQLILGFLRPTSGQIRFLGQEITGQRHPDMAIILQDGGLFPWKTIIDNITLGADCRHSLDQDLLKRLVSMMKLTPHLAHYPHQLSGGEKQRVAVVRSLLMKPKLLLLDEPFSALDFAIKQELMDLLHQLSVQFSFSSLLVTHDPHEASYYASQIHRL